jgi:hypothetical protein
MQNFNAQARKPNLATQHPEIVIRLGTRMEELDAEVTQNARALWNKP